jgi:small subunit ribosomal protein S24e
MAVESQQGPVVRLDSGIYTLVSQKENKVIQRREAVLRIEHRNKGTPSRLDVIEAISKLFGIDKSLLVVRRIETEYGRDSSKAWVHIYGDRATLERFEPKYLLQRSEKKEEKGGS